MNKKQIITLILIITLSLGLVVGCGATTNKDDVSLEDMVGLLCKDIDVPAYEVIKLNKDNYEYYSFSKYEDGITAVAADALVNITAHSLVLIHTDNGDSQAIAQEVLDNADPNKWLCVRAESVKVAYGNDYVLLVMSDKDIAKGIIQNFSDMFKNEVEILG